MSSISPIINLIADLDCYADELAVEDWHNAANGCRAAIAEIERLRAVIAEDGKELDRLRAMLKG